jgi:hypothetical protein
MKRTNRGSISHTPERQSDPSDRAATSVSAVTGDTAAASDRAARASRTRGVARREADRHAAAVVAEEIRRLSRYWRSDGRRTTTGRRRGAESPRPKEAF